MNDLRDFVRESNRIEGIHREPTDAEVRATELFLTRDIITVDDLRALVNAYAPGAALRNSPGMDVWVGNYLPPRGGTEVVRRLARLLTDTVDWQTEPTQHRLTPYAAHIEYERIHPFMDGNGRSGRALWLWMMGGVERAPLGFLHHFYYQSLAGTS